MALGDYYHVENVRTAAVLTNSYVAGTVIGPTSSGVYKIDCTSFNQITIKADFTIGSLTDCDIKVEFSDDGTDYSQETSSSFSSGEDTLSLAHHTMAATGVYEINMPISARFIKISAIGNGTVTSSSLAIDVELSTK